MSKKPILSAFAADETGQWNNHVELGLWADVMLIAPASANTLAKCAHGICDNLLVATYLSARCAVYFAPAMDLDMYAHFSTKNNLKLLTDNANYVIEPNEGELASGLEGKGRMAEPEEMVEVLKAQFAQNPTLIGKKVLISAGPTQEDIDPVRYISNHSSGKMGFEIAKAFSLAGAAVTLVAGPNSLKTLAKVNNIGVRSAAEMFAAMAEYHADADIVIFSAAVADYKPKTIAEKKLKKNDGEMFVELERTQDIAGFLGGKKSGHQIHVGFALETNDELQNAKRKLERKNFDMIVLNSLQDKGAGFRYDTNKITILDKRGNESIFDLKSKEMVAEDIKKSVLAYINHSAK